MMKLLVACAMASLLSCGIINAQSPPVGGQWGCPSIPLTDEFDTTCFQRLGEIQLGQGYFDRFGTSDPVYFVIPDNRPEYAISIAVAWHYYRNVLGHDQMNINQWSATMVQENGFSTYNGAVLPATVWDESTASNYALPCTYPRGCNSNSCAGAGYCWHVSQNGNDGSYHNTLAGYQTAAPYFPQRLITPEATYHPLFNSNMAMASMAKTFYDMSIYRRAQLMNGANMAAIELGSADPYGLEAAQAVAYNLGPNAGNAISAPGYVPDVPGLTASTFWGGTHFTGGVSSYAENVEAITAVLNDDEAHAWANWPASTNWEFYSFYDQPIAWATVNQYLTELQPMYPEIDAAFIATIQTAFNNVNGGLPLSFRYEMGAVIDAIVMNLPKEDPAFNAQYTINGTGCSLGCRAPYTTIKPQGPTDICTGQFVELFADVDGATPSTTYQWYRDGVLIGGATNDTYYASTSGTYSIVVCWETTHETSGATVTCCAQPQCEVEVNVDPNCSTCGMTMNLNANSNTCTGSFDGSIDVSLFGAPGGPYTYTWTGPVSGSTSNSLTNYTITGLRDGKYTVQVHQNADPTCLAVLDIVITPTLVVKETVNALASPLPGCNTQLDAEIVNQQPNTCEVDVYWGSLNVQSWDRSFAMDVRVNGNGTLSLYEGYSSTGTHDDPWDWWPFAWPTNNAPNSSPITVSDGDTISVYGSVLLPLGIPAPGFLDGGVLMEGATFTNLTTFGTSAGPTWRYQGAAPTPGTRKVGDSWVVTCPVVSPPAYTFDWTPKISLTPAAGNIQNPVAGSQPDGGRYYTVTITHPLNTNCKLSDSVHVDSIGGCAPLPVVWLSFSATKNSKAAELMWQTTQEDNNSHFIVQHSLNGSDFTAIGRVEAGVQGGSGINNYYLTHTRMSPGVNYYRVVQYDYDGAASYSEIRSLYLQEVGLEVSPNPFADATTVTVNGPSGSAINLQVLAVTGKVVARYNNVVPGQSISLGDDFVNGVYIIKVISGDEVKTVKVVKNQ